MNSHFTLISFLLLFIASCSGPNCNCDLLFKDKDSLVSISESPDPKIQELIANRHNLRNKYENLRLQISEENENDISDIYDDELRTTKLIRELHEIKQQEMKTEMELHTLLRRSIDRKSQEKFIPYTGTCFKLGAKGEVIYEAEYENGKLVSEKQPE